MRFVEERLAKQVSHSSIVSAAEGELGVSRRQAYRLINYAYERMELNSEAERPMRRQQMVQSLRYIAQRAIEADKLGDAIAAYDRVCRIYGLYDDKLRIQGEVKIMAKPDLSQLTDDELATLEDMHRRVLSTEVIDMVALPEAEGDDGDGLTYEQFVTGAADDA